MSPENAQKLMDERDALLDAIRKTAEEFESISWGWDGDCGTSNIIERLTDHLPENATTHPTT